MTTMRTAAMGGLAILALTGCGEPPRTVRYLHPAGFEVIRAERAAWEREYPEQAVRFRRQESQAIAAQASRNGMSGWGQGVTDSRGTNGVQVCMSRLRGIYHLNTREAWVFCDDPTDLTTDEQWTEVHEIAHGVEHLEGWDAAALLWDSLPRSHRTHPEIEERLRGHAH